MLRQHPSPLQPHCKHKENLENLTGWILPSWSKFCCAFSLAYMNAPALEHLLAKRSQPLAVPTLQSPEQGFSRLIQPSPQNCITILQRNDWYSSPPDAGVEDCLVSLPFCGVDLQSCMHWRRTHNRYSCVAEGLPAAWWPHFPAKSSGDSRRGCKFGRSFSRESHWGSWEWAPLWPLTSWPPLCKVRMIMVFSWKGFLE